MALKCELQTVSKLYAAIMITIALLSFSLSTQADVDPSKSVKFRNGNRIYTEGTKLFFAFANGERVSLNGDHSYLIEAKQSRPRAVIVEDRNSPSATHRFLIQENGHVSSLPIRMESAIEWSHSSLLDNGILYDVVSIKYNKPNKNTVMVIRSSDGHRLRMQTEKYLDQSAESFEFIPKVLGWDLDRFEANHGYSNNETGFDRNLFLGYSNGRFNRITQDSSSSIASGFAGITNKIQFGLEALMDEFQSNNGLEDKLNNRVFGQAHLVM